MINYNPLSFSTAKADIVGRTAGNIGGSIINAVRAVDTIVKQKDAKEKLQVAYRDTVSSFIKQAKEINPELSDAKAQIMAMKVYKPPLEDLDLKTNYERLLSGDDGAQKLLDKLEAETKKATAQSQASAFSQKMTQPVTTSRQVQAEGPPIPPPTEEGPPQYPPERIGEVPMETQTTRRPIRESEYNQQFNQLSPEAQKFVPETLKGQVASTEQVFQQPLKTFEDQRTAQLKEREGNIKTMTGVDKDAGYRTAIIESKDTVESLNTKKKTLGSLIKTVTKANNLPPRQVGDKGTALRGEIDDLAAQLDIPAELANDPEFLGRMEAEIDRLIDKEANQQKEWEISLADYKKRLKDEAARKAAPRPPAATPTWRLAKELQTALKDMTKQQFPDLYKVMEGEYSTDVMKQVSGVAEAARAIMSDPKKRIALAYAFPEEVGAIAQAKGAPRPADAEINAVLEEMQQLQNQVYGVIKSPAAGGTPAAQPDNNPLGIRLD